MKKAFKFILIISTVFLTSCVNQKLIHGNLPEAQLVSLLEIGKDSKESTSKILGQPTFKGILGDNSFYYIGTVNKKIAFLKPKLNNQYVLELNFDSSNILNKIYLYDENQTINVAMSSMETKSTGKKVSFLQQLFRSMGVSGVGRGQIIGSGKADN